MVVSACLDAERREMEGRACKVVCVIGCAVQSTSAQCMRMHVRGSVCPRVCCAASRQHQRPFARTATSRKQERDPGAHMAQVPHTLLHMLC